MAADRLRRVYDLQTQEETDAYYTDWASTYDEELERNGYRTPGRCVEALARFVPLDQPVLDVGCGTGLSGVALAAGGFSDVSGQDVNDAMLDVARRRGVYREVRLADLDDPFPFEPGTFAACTAIGVIGFGAAPATLLREVLDSMAPGGHLVFSFNDLAVNDPGYGGALAEVLDSGVAEQVFDEYGPHFDALGSESMVYVLRRR